MAQQREIALLADLHRAERSQMRRDELAVEQFDPTHAQRHHQPGQRHFRRLADAREHALSAEHPVEPHAIKAADQHGCAIGTILPALDRMGEAQRVELLIGARDAVADPCFARGILTRIAAMGHARRGAGGQHLREGRVAGDAQPAAPQGARQRMRAAKAIERQNAAPFGLDPEDVGVVAPVSHGKDTAAIGQHHQ